MPQCRHLTALCCIIRLLLNSVFSLSPNLTMKTFCNGYKKFIHQDQRQHQQVNSNCDSKQGVNSRCLVQNTQLSSNHSVTHPLSQSHRDIISGRQSSECRRLSSIFFYSFFPSLPIYAALLPHAPS